MAGFDAMTNAESGLDFGILAYRPDRLGESSGLECAARFMIAGREVAIRPWTRAEWDALPASKRPEKAGVTDDGRFVVALDFVPRRS